ncbi:FAD-dependent oxidoreductase [Aerolutibacter ruishenii]|uniref:2-octaprenyl-3-methyl-6-methoxy-1,4-benzoquinol hydroxylase n=1 Tax=Aerolutibacter ruishenii TaxID=686800 RepID=A0A562M274_9GAMM|nr:FAD-dependent oxidoreductase [Lysobacter ruishenii]TWI14057.1 2-octaprenyl-3-methyl-6-methoxy-1,4-benzoquinol hydroxylase [Lysobacter ruishenii]
MSRREMLDVVVVGAGVVGAAAALAFARDGLQVALVEAREPVRWRADEADLRVYAFAPDNAALLDSVGAWQPVLQARAQPYRRMCVWDAAGGAPLEFDADGFARSELGWIVENGLLVDRLWAQQAAAGVRIHCPDHVVALQQDATSATVELDSGRRLKARLVVAADGAGSRLRELAGVGVGGHAYHQRGVVAFVDTEHPHQATCWQRFLPTGPLAFLPFVEDGGGGGVAGRRSSIVWTLPDAEAERMLAMDDRAFLQALERAFDGPLGAMRAVSRRAAFPLRLQLARHVVAGRVAIIGDAAHAVHPLAGQGVNLGLRDVAALRGTLRAAGDGDIGGPERLARWARRRRSENALAAYSFDGINRLFSNEAMLPTLVRGPLLGMVGKVPALTHLFWRRAAGV